MELNRSKQKRRQSIHLNDDFLQDVLLRLVKPYAELDAPAVKISEITWCTQQKMRSSFSSHPLSPFALMAGRTGTKESLYGFCELPGTMNGPTANQFLGQGKIQRCIDLTLIGFSLVAGSNLSQSQDQRLPLVPVTNPDLIL